MKIIVDAMGGDNAPMAPVEAAVRAVKELDVEIVLVGKKEVVEKELSAYDYQNDKISIAIFTNAAFASITLSAKFSAKAYIHCPFIMSVPSKVIVSSVLSTDIPS